jgi:hypothetical protein
MAGVLRERGCAVALGRIEFPDRRYTDLFSEFPFEHADLAVARMLSPQLKHATESRMRKKIVRVSYRQFGNVIQDERAGKTAVHADASRSEILEVPRILGENLRAFGEVMRSQSCLYPLCHGRSLCAQNTEQEVVSRLMASTKYEKVLRDI